MNHNELREKALKKVKVTRAYKELEPEYKLLKSMLSARHHTGLCKNDFIAEIKLSAFLSASEA
jgi:hypothetical protein